MLSFPFSPRLLAAALLAGPLWLQATTDTAAHAWQRFQAQAQAALTHLANEPAPEANEEVPVLELRFDTLFAPMKERGLEYADTLRALEGRRVRLSGHMVREAVRVPGVFVVTPRPLRLDGSGSGEVSDLPPTAVHVRLSPDRAAAVVGYRPGMVSVTGVLSLGVAAERDGRNSVARLLLDEASSAHLSGETH